MKPEGERVTIQAVLRPEQLLEELVEDVRRGLSAKPKYLPPKYFYDETGSGLFAQICGLPEYYQTRTEQKLLESVADELVAALGTVGLVEFGAGNAQKTRVLLDAMRRAGTLGLYVPIDVCERTTRKTAETLLRDYPELRVHGLVADFSSDLTAQLPPDGTPRLFAFLGSTIGNLNPDQAARFLGQLSGWMQPHDWFLLGVDLIKDLSLLEAAYNDTAGVTADFNRNVLRVLNRNLGAGFQLERFEHWAFFNAAESRIEMHLRAKTRHEVAIPKAGLTVAFEQGETILTEISCKYTQETVAAMLRRAVLEPVRWNTDAAAWFGLSLSRVS